MVKHLIELNTIDSFQVVIDVRQIVALERHSLREQQTRIWLQGGHILVVKKDIQSVREAWEAATADLVAAIGGRAMHRGDVDAVSNAVSNNAESEEF